MRWQIEEGHRQVKVDYHWEEIRLQRYEALKKTMNALLWMAVSFLYTRLERFAVKIISLSELVSLKLNLCKKKDFWFTELELSQKKIDFGESSISIEKILQLFVALW